MDKTALNYANLLGYQETLQLKGQQFNYLSASMYLDTPAKKLKADRFQWCMPATSLVNTRVDGSLEGSQLNASWE